MKQEDVLINAVLMGDVRPLTPQEVKWAIMHEEMHKAYHEYYKAQKEKKL